MKQVDEEAAAFSIFIDGEPSTRISLHDWHLYLYGSRQVSQSEYDYSEVSFP